MSNAYNVRGRKEIGAGCWSENLNKLDDFEDL